jgi:hypothetical protein
MSSHKMLMRGGLQMYVAILVQIQQTYCKEKAPLCDGGTNFNAKKPARGGPWHFSISINYSHRRKTKMPTLS